MVGSRGPSSSQDERSLASLFLDKSGVAMTVADGSTENMSSTQTVAAKIIDATVSAPDLISCMTQRFQLEFVLAHAKMSVSIVSLLQMLKKNPFSSN